MPRLAKTTEQIREEIREVIEERLPLVKAYTSGKQHFLSISFSSEQERSHSPLIWIMRAQSGTLDKIETLFAREGEYEGFELVAIARNLLENLIWLRLFNRDHRYGLMFYEQLLAEQEESTKKLIDKVQGEITLFEEYSHLEDELMNSTIETLKGGHLAEDEIKKVMEEQRTLEADLDRRVRRTFALYGAAAQFNGYSFQCHLLRNEVVPKHLHVLEHVQRQLADLRLVKSKLLGDLMLGPKARWNWRASAEKVDMLSQYDFLYSYTSKLLHASPLNIITEKMLSPSETLMMLDYIFITVCDVLDEVERFSFPGQVNVALFEVE